MRRQLLLLIAVAASGLLASVSGAAPKLTPVPGCPDLEGWNHAGVPGTIDSGDHVQFRCTYSQPGRGEQPSYDAFWSKPSARDVDVNYNDCGRAASGGSYYQDIWSKTHFVNVEYRVSGGVSAATSAAVFQAERARLDRTALALLAATEKLAKSCTKTVSKPVDTVRPTVKVRGAKGRAGSAIVLRFTVGDNSGKVRIALTVYKPGGLRTVVLRRSFPVSAPSSKRSYTATVRIGSVGTHLWCIVASDAAGNSLKRCALLIVV